MYSAGSRLLAALGGLWGPRILWLAIGVAGAWSVGEALDGRSAAVRTTVMIGAWVVWGIGVVALVVPSALGLTVMRMVAALACGAAVVSWIGGAGPTAAACFLACALIGGLLIGGAGFGQSCVQASAYGDEQRFLLRPPAAFLLPVVVAGLVWTTAMIAAPLLLASATWILGAVVAIVAVLSTWLLLPRFGALSRRWLVFVPAGIVVHDPVVLGDTMMVSRPDIVGIDLALADTQAADLTGPAAGHAVEVNLRSMATVVLAPTKIDPRGKALHVQAFIVAPTRPGMVLRAARRTGPPQRLAQASEATTQHIAVAGVEEDHALTGSHAALRGTPANRVALEPRRQRGAVRTALHHHVSDVAADRPTRRW